MASQQLRNSFSMPASTVIVTGRYSGAYKATGKKIDAQFAHFWTLADGKVTRFQQYTDTLQAAQAAKA